jgi:hypothetical protein
MDALFSVDDDSSDRGFDASVDDVLSLKLRNPVATVASVRFVVWDASGFDATRPPAENPPRASKGAPLLTLNNGAGSTGSSVLAATVATPVTVTMPATAGHSWIVRCIVNSGQKTLADGRVVVAPELIHERMIVVRFASGARNVVATETTQYEVDGWAGALSEALALV